MQNGVTIGTPERELIVVYGDYEKKEDAIMALCSFKYILTDLNSIRTDYFRLGFHLSEFENSEYYKDLGFLTFESFVDANLQMDKGTVSRCINVFREFCSKQYDYTGALEKRFNSISDDYKEYNYSQLCEMLPLSKENRKKIKPEMTIKEIRELKKCFTKKKNVSQVATSQPDNVIESNQKDLSKVVKLHGSALQSFVKSLTKDDLENCDDILLYVFDSQGKPVKPVFNIGACVLYRDKKGGKDNVYLKLPFAINEKEGVKT